MHLAASNGVASDLNFVDELGQFEFVFQSHFRQQNSHFAGKNRTHVADSIHQIAAASWVSQRQQLATDFDSHRIHVEEVFGFLFWWLGLGSLRLARRFFFALLRADLLLVDHDG